MATGRWRALAWRTAGLISFLGTASVAIDAHAQSIERGRQLYENHCTVCHTAQIHGRKQRNGLTTADLREIVDRWQTSQKLRWSREDIDDVVRFLAVTRYDLSTEAGQAERVAAGRLRP